MAHTLHAGEHRTLVGQDTQDVAVVDHVVVHPVQRLVLVVEPFPDQLRRREAHSRLLKQLAGAASEVELKPIISREPSSLLQKQASDFRARKPPSRLFLQQIRLHTSQCTAGTCLPGNARARARCHGRVEAAADVPPRGGFFLGDEQLGAAQVVDVNQRHRAERLYGSQHAERRLVA